MRPQLTSMLFMGLLLVSGCDGKSGEEQTVDSQSDKAGQTTANSRQGESKDDDANDIIVAGEGDFRIKMPLDAPREGLLDLVQLPPIKLQLMADSTGRLASIRLNETRFENWAAVQEQIIAMLGDNREPRTRPRITELELSCDYKLRYEHVINAITAVAGFVNKDGQVVKLIEKVMFASPKKMPAPPDAQPGDPDDPREGVLAKVESDQRVNLPESELAKLRPFPYEAPIVLRVTKSGDVILRGKKQPMEAIARCMQEERQHLQSKRVSLGDATVIIRADRECPTGKIQELIRICQEQQFEQFALRAKGPT